MCEVQISPSVFLNLILLVAEEVDLHTAPET